METKFSLMIFLAVVVSFSLSQVFAQDDSSWIDIEIGSSALYAEIVNDKVYVTNPADGKIAIIDANTRELVDNIDAPEGILIIESVPEKNKLYATVDDQNKVYVFDLTTNTIIKEIDIGEPEIVRFSKADKPYGQREYAYFQTNGVGLAYNPNNEMLYVAHSAVNHVNVIDTKIDQTVDTITAGKTPLLIKIDTKSNVGYVTNWESNDVTIIDLNTNKVKGSLQTGFVPNQMTIDQDNNRLYVTHLASRDVTVIDLRDSTIEQKIQLKGPTHAIALDPTSDILHVTYNPESGFTGDSFIDRVEFIDTKTNKLIGGNEIPANPFTIRITENKMLFAPVIKEGIVYAIDLTQRDVYQDIEEKSETMQEQSDSTGGGCLIATASFGSELAHQVQTLREVRDNTLLSTTSGVAFMAGFNQIYYSFSPTIADWERQNPVFKETMKTFITPMISTLSIMKLAEQGSEHQVLALGISVILLNLGMYFGTPIAAFVTIRNMIRKNKVSNL